MGPGELTELAVKNNEIDKLLLGEPPYFYNEHYCRTPGETNLNAIFSFGIYPYAVLHAEVDFKAQVEALIPACLETVEGLVTLVNILFIESYTRHRGNKTLDLDLQQLAQVLRQQIAKHEVMLRSTFILGGENMREGMLGDFKRISKIIAEDGGPEFVQV